MFSHAPFLNVGALSIHQHESKTVKFKPDLVVHLVQALPVERSSEQVTDQASEQVMHLLDCLTPGPLSTQAAMECLELKHRPSFLANYLRPALEAGLVEMTHPDSPKSPTQKYRLKRTN